MVTSTLLSSIKKSGLSLLVLLFFGFMVKGQSVENFVHCFGNDTLFIEKISEITVGDTVIKEYQDHTFLNNPNDSTFEYYFFNDSVFIKYDNEFYIIGDNNAQVGDVWHPIRFELGSYTDTTENCPFHMNLEVVAVDEILINGTPTKYFSLKDLDWTIVADADHKFLAGVGATMSGPLYNLMQVLPCDLFVEYSLAFRSYQIGDFTYVENTCVTSIEDISQSDMAISIFPNPSNESVTLEFDTPEKSEFRLSVFNLGGQQVVSKKISNSPYRLDVSQLTDGIYFYELIGSQENQGTSGKFEVQKQ
jgi:hypothetical protein